jgi:hypothetical protein
MDIGELDSILIRSTIVSIVLKTAFRKVRMNYYPKMGAYLVPMVLCVNPVIMMEKFGSKIS